MLEVANELVDLERQFYLEKEIKKQGDLAKELVKSLHHGILFGERLEASENHAGEPIIEYPDMLLLILPEEWQEDLGQRISDPADRVLVKVPQVGDLSDQVYQ